MAATPLSILICDDEQPARERLQQMLDSEDAWQVIGEAAHGKEALELSQRLKPDIILLDIRMPEMDGIEAARHLALLESGPAVIFTTAYDRYAIEAFETHAVGYLLKPIRRERLRDVLRHVVKLSHRQLRGLLSDPVAAPRKHICIRSGKNLNLIAVEQIRSFQAEQKYIAVHHQGGRDLLDEPLKQLADEFAESFVRIHRSALVSVACLERLEKRDDGGYDVWLHDAEQPLPVSRRHVATVKQRLKDGK